LVAGDHGLDCEFLAAPSRAGNVQVCLRSQRGPRASWMRLLLVKLRLVELLVSSRSWSDAVLPRCRSVASPPVEQRRPAYRRITKGTVRQSTSTWWSRSALFSSNGAYVSQANDGASRRILRNFSWLIGHLLGTPRPVDRGAGVAGLPPGPLGGGVSVEKYAAELNGEQLPRASPDRDSQRPSFRKEGTTMNPAPTRTQTHHLLATPLTSAFLTNAALEQMQAALARQDRELDAAYSSVSGLVDARFAVHRELLEEIEIACTTRPATPGALHTLARC
jgi:hypothetical protein